MNFERLRQTVQNSHLEIFAAFHPGPDDLAPNTCKTLLLLGPHEPGFWAHVSSQPEFTDGAQNPLDRWSKRIAGKIASAISAQAVFPSDGPPYPPFIAWALQSGWVYASPVGLLVHHRAGLFVSFRAALALSWAMDLPKPPPTPCETCSQQPCRTACPIGALSRSQYDVEACRSYLSTPAGDRCKKQGCLARRSCPASQSYGRLDAQSAFHMKAFHSS